MSDQMEFPETFDEFAEDFGFKDREEIYTNGAELIPVFRVKQWLEHDNKLRTIETDTAYECGKYANKWIPVSERLPEESLNSVIGWDAYRERCVFVQYIDGHFQITGSDESFDILAWMPLPEQYNGERESK